MLDPIDYFLYSEFVEPEMKYECRGCGTFFGDDCARWSEEAQAKVTVCPGCGRTVAVGNEEGE